MCKLTKITYAWDLTMGFTYVDGPSVTFSYANVTYVEHITMFVRSTILT